MQPKHLPQFHPAFHRARREWVAGAGSTAAARAAAEGATTAEASAKDAEGAISAAPVQVPDPSWAAVQGPQGAYFYNATTQETAWQQPMTKAPTMEEAQGKAKGTPAKKGAKARVKAAEAQLKKGLIHTFVWCAAGHGWEERAEPSGPRVRVPVRPT